MSLCERCEDLRCTVCGHEACPVCEDECDHTDCIDWKSGRMDHACVFPPCPSGCVRGDGLGDGAA
jgi:hypothetical protein